LLWNFREENPRKLFHEPADGVKRGFTKPVGLPRFKLCVRAVCVQFASPRVDARACVRAVYADWSVNDYRISH